MRRGKAACLARTHRTLVHGNLRLPCWRAPWEALQQRHVAQPGARPRLRAAERPCSSKSAVTAACADALTFNAPSFSGPHASARLQHVGIRLGLSGAQRSRRGHKRVGVCNLSLALGGEQSVRGAVAHLCGSCSVLCRNQAASELQETRVVGKWRQRTQRLLCGVLDDTVCAVVLTLRAAQSARTARCVARTAQAHLVAEEQHAFHFARMCRVARQPKHARSLSHKTRVSCIRLPSAEQGAPSGSALQWRPLALARHAAVPRAPPAGLAVVGTPVILKLALVTRQPHVPRCEPARKLTPANSASATAARLAALSHSCVAAAAAAASARGSVTAQLSTT
jgi:hypothetical protein